ncbi:MAG: putative Fe-S cluster protein YjdI [Flavobacteriales bacterium]|jgi:uncharacterized Fe-S cluster protein YjdI
MGKDMKNEYSNGEITIVWKPSSCIHSTKCWKGEEGLLSVFNPNEKPWIKPGGASTEEIINQVNKCPSGALSFYYNNQKEEKKEMSEKTKVVIAANGPMLVHGQIAVTHKDGTEELKENVTAFCRCGESKNKPFCDGTHKTSGFKDE